MATASLLLWLLWPYVALARPGSVSELVLEPSAIPVLSPTRNSSFIDGELDQGPVHLLLSLSDHAAVSLAGTISVNLCECEKAVGFPDGLGCDKEGWFITGFENQGTWIGGGGLVPLSHAVCCRPCLPSQLPPSAPTTAMPANEPDPDEPHPVAIVSIGCHPSSGRAFKALQCELNGASFVTGFSQAERVNSYYFDVFYPVGQTECCTPAILMSTGHVHKVERCDCVLSHTKDCGGLSSNRLLWGFAEWRVTRSGEYLPIAPLACCGLCLGDHVHDSGNCEDLGYCHDNGICTLGACECFEGYGSSDCSVAEEGGDGFPMPWWALLLISFSTVLFLSASLIALRNTFMLGSRRHQDHQRTSTDANDARQPLLFGFDNDDAGSAGSNDTESDEEGSHQHLHHECDPVALESNVLTVQYSEGAALMSHQSGALSEVSFMAAELANEHDELNRQSGRGNQVAEELAQQEVPESPAASHNTQHLSLPPQQQPPGTPPSEHPSSNSQAVEAACDDDCSKTLNHDKQQLASEMSAGFGSGTCVVCMERPVQVVLVPCGHAHVCRRCSRRLQRCPFCRRDISRRQRLFFSS